MRKFFYFHSDNWDDRGSFSIETGKFPMVGAALQIAGGDSYGNVMIALHCVYSLYLTLDWKPIREFLQRFPTLANSKNGWGGHGRALSLGWLYRDHYIRWNLFGYVINEPKRWRDGTFWYLNWLLGYPKHSETVEKTGECEVVLPEKRYAGTYKIFTSTWKRPRWFTKKRIRRITIDVPEGLPVPGKGENSWDCGDDAIFGSTFPLGEYDTIYTACKKLALDCMETRSRYSSIDWLPSKVSRKNPRTQAQGVQQIEKEPYSDANRAEA